MSMTKAGWAMVLAGTVGGLLGLPAGASTGEEHVNSDSGATTIYDFTVQDIDGKEVKLAQYRGNVCLVVNVASK